MKIRIFIISIFCLILFGCSDTDDSAKLGQSDNWEVFYSRAANIVIKYVGEGETPKEIEYVITEGSRTRDGHDSLDNEGTLEIKRTFSKVNNTISVEIL